MQRSTLDRWHEKWRPFFKVVQHCVLFAFLKKSCKNREKNDAGCLCCGAALLALKAKGNTAI